MGKGQEEQMRPQPRGTPASRNTQLVPMAVMLFGMPAITSYFISQAYGKRQTLGRRFEMWMWHPLTKLFIHKEM